MSALSRTLVATAAAVASLLAATASPLAPAGAAVAPGDEVIAWLEVEDGAISGGPALNSGDHGNFSGTGSYTFRETGMTSTMTFTAPAAGVYPVHIRYAAGPLSAEENVTRSMGLLANGARQQVAYPMTSFGDWEAWQFASTQVTLVEGQNTLAIQCDRGIDLCRLNFDAIQVGGATPDPCVATAPGEGWTSLFDGTFATFDGWRKAGAGGFGRQTDCTIRSIRGAGATWFTQQQVAPYTLEVDWRRNDSNDDSSIHLGSSTRGATPTGGVRIRIGADDTGVIEPAGGAQVPADAAALSAAVRGVGEWNTYRIEVTPTGVVVRLNGELVNSFAGAVPANGFIGLENRSFLDAVDFRTIRIRAGVEPEVPDPVASTTTMLIKPTTIRAGSGSSVVTVAVTAGETTPETEVDGQAEIWVAGVKKATVAVVDGRASAKVGPFSTVGTRTVQARYLGSPTVLPSNSTVGKVVVAKAVSTMAVVVQPSKIVKRKTRPTVVVAVRAAGFAPSGVVRVTVLGKTYAGRLSGGKVTVRLPAFRKPGTFRAVVAYAGDARTMKVSKAVSIRVVRR
ncbi:hypothetical protein ASE01_20960 [Nocardioides sp. Root190]|uniref:family 16 glycoside hydrolase n=1 Tax=Nocardioides sp. Root190 TaxID=1736488 RepID=UPI0006F69379|nr:family 16 glycoside hydrolase [Nocardioides sp. Root190]KRB73226.1 hypothetical protein ASE01_20960 [Nocardioides sp. Root190]